jgi:subtilisin family serine protease
MKRIALCLALAMLWFGPSAAHGGDAAEALTTVQVGHTRALVSGLHGYVADEVLIRYRPYVSPARRNVLVAGLRAQILNSFDQLSVLRVRLTGDLPVGEALEKLQAEDDVEYAEPNYIRTLALIPTNTDFTQQWAFNNTGQTVNGIAGTPGADIGMPGAWDLNTGSRNVVVAVIDTGVYYGHPDLAANISQGWDFVDNDDDPMDFNGHGTHVAGIIGAAGSDHAGTVGVNWSVQIMPLRVLDSMGNGTVADVIAAVQYATNVGAEVINASFGGEDPSTLESSAIQAFIAGGGIFVAAAGNAGSNNDVAPFYPASYGLAGMIAVAATDATDALTSWSNYGPNSVAVAAPGNNILSTYLPPRQTVYSDSFAAMDWTSGGVHNTWGVENGWLSDSPGQNYLPGTNSWACSPLISLASETGCRLTYGLNATTVQNLDFLYTETSSDDVNWTTQGSFTGSTGGVQSIYYDLEPYNGGNLYVRFHLVTAPSSPGAAGVLIDNVMVTCLSTPVTGAYYAYLSGTSMAAPMVSGLAALIKATNPTLTNLEIQQIVQDSVDVKQTLAGKVESGGRIDANKAINMATLGLPTLYAASGQSAVTLTWSSASGQPTGYIVERSSSSGGPYSTIASLSANQLSYVDSSAQRSAPYYYLVRAENNVSESLPSNEASAEVTGSGSSTGGGGGGGGGGGCFIATAAFGSYLAPEVMVLRQFRDRYLLTSPTGRWFVAIYYHYSPPLAEIIRDHTVLRVATRLLLTPLVYGVKYPQCALAVIFLCLGGAGLIFLVQRHSKIKRTVIVHQAL